MTGLHVQLRSHLVIMHLLILIFRAVPWRNMKSAKFADILTSRFSNICSYKELRIKLLPIAISKSTNLSLIATFSPYFQATLFQVCND